jgi:hypothetical protein
VVSGTQRKKREHGANGREDMDRGGPQPPPAHGHPLRACAGLEPALDLSEHGDVAVGIERRQTLIQLQLLVLAIEQLEAEIELGKKRLAEDVDAVAFGRIRFGGGMASQGQAPAAWLREPARRRAKAVGRGFPERRQQSA